LLAACAALWGVETGQWVVAALLALVLESHRLIHARWDISSEDIRKLATVCNVILLLVVAYFLTLTAARATLPKVLQWLPVILLPLMVASQFSTTGKINPAALFESTWDIRSQCCWCWPPAAATSGTWCITPG
jgi:hypothetical protein